VAEYDDAVLVVLEGGFLFVVLTVTVGEQQTIGLCFINEHIGGKF